MDLRLGSGDDVLIVDDTLVGTTTIDTGAGHDRVFLEAIGGTTSVHGIHG